MLARAHLERYRQLADPTDLGAARSALTGVSVDRLGTPDRAEFLIALGGSLFLEDDFGAAAEVFESAMEIAPAAGDERPRVGARLVRRGHGALGRALRHLAARPDVDPPGGPHGDASRPRTRARGPPRYWLAAGLRAQGDTDRAWQAAIAAWVRAPLAGDGALPLRADIDRLVLEGIIPDRGREAPEGERESREAALRAEWELVKQKWK